LTHSGKKKTRKTKPKKLPPELVVLSALLDKMDELDSSVRRLCEKDRTLEDSVRLQSVNNQRNVEAMIKAAAEMVEVFNKLANLKAPKRKWWRW